MRPTKQVCSKRTWQNWRPSKNPADVGSQVLFSRIYLKINMRPKLCNPSHEARQTSSFKTYFPNLTALENSSRRWITGFNFKGFIWKWICGSNYVILRMTSTRQVRSKRSSQTWRPSKNPADAGSQDLCWEAYSNKANTNIYIYKVIYIYMQFGSMYI